MGYCSLPFTRMKIGSNGEFHSCCHQKITYGNLIEDNLTLETAFQNNILKQVQEYVSAGKLHPICDTPRCPFYTIKAELQPSENEIPIQPTDIELALPSTHCNIGGTEPTADSACSMCPRASKAFMEQEPKKDLTAKLVAKIRPYVKNINKLNIQGIAEPFWKNKVIDILDVLDFKNNNQNARFWSFTNGTVFGDKVQDAFLSKVRWSALGFSVDAATPETYKKIRKLNYFHVIERNIKKYVNKVKKFDHADAHHWTFTTFNINMLNVHEMVQMVEWSHSLGVNNCEFTLTFNGAPEFIMGEENLCNENNWEIFWQGQQDALKRGKELGFRVDFYVPFHGGFLK